MAINEVMVKPQFNEEIKAEIKGIATIENNIQKAKEFALSLREYYSNITFTEEEKKTAEEEKAEINKQKKIVEDFRKKIVEEFNKPIAEFEKTAKETEKILKETYEFINNQVKEFDHKEIEQIKARIRMYFDEYADSQGLDFVCLEDMNMNINSINILNKAYNLYLSHLDQYMHVIFLQYYQQYHSLKTKLFYYYFSIHKMYLN